VLKFYYQAIFPGAELMQMFTLVSGTE